MKDFTYYEKQEYSLMQQYENIRKELPGFIRLFLHQLKGRPQTLRDRAYDYLSFLQYLQIANPLFHGINTVDISVDNFSEIVSDDINQYIQSLTEKFSNHSINRKISSLRILFRYLSLRGDIPYNPSEGISIPYLVLPFSVLVSFAAYSFNSSHVAGAFSGSRPASVKASLL